MNIGKKDYTFDDLIGIIKMLRSEDGCPWDRVQTHDSVKMNLIEESYEAIEALDSGDKDAFADELGDVLLQVVFHSCIGESDGTFTINDVLRHVCDKMISRHTHIFGTDKAATPEEVLDTWDKNKQKEKGNTSITQDLKDVCSYLPALMRAQKVSKKSAKSGLDWENISDVLSQLKSEIKELEDAIASGNTAYIEDELGDVIFTAVNVARFADIKAETALNHSTDKFITRFEAVENAAEALGKPLSEMTADEQDKLWKEAKAQTDIV
ncbi:MAG: nucleoside triphosphate pyrophosphohydrolase [Clostridia bacterium]|nr:nucleoside triphosphate pyrophosphohydrolase [Clostridia bacterium]